MPAWAILISLTVKAVMLVGLVFMFLRGRLRECWSFTIYLLVVFVTSSLMSLWPSHFFNHEFYLVSQGLYDLLKLLVAIEIAHRVFRQFPGARVLVHTVILGLLVLTTLAFLAIPRHVPYQTWFDWQPRIIASTVWLFTATTFLILWFRVPVRRWYRDILLGFTAYLLVFVTLLGILRDHGWDLRVLFGIVDAVAYLALVTWWAWAAWRRNEEPEISPVIAQRLGLEPHRVVVLAQVGRGKLSMTLGSPAADFAHDTTPIQRRPLSS